MRRLARLDPSLVLVALTAALVAGLGWRQRWATDDAYINFRVVDNLLDGSGPVFNAGERVEAYTSPLWLALLAAVHGVLGVDLAWTSVVLGLALSVAGVAMGCLGALLLWRGDGSRRVGLPLGALVFAVPAATWDFLTSGLETGLTFAWLGGSFLALADLHRRAEAGGRWRPRPAAVAVLIGLGPLVRPDLALFAAAFLAALLVLDRRWRLLAWAAALPAAYQLFRMGYFAALVPNTAFAKEAGKPYGSRGWEYLRDFADPYALAIPLLALAALAVLEVRRRGGALRSPAAAVAAAPAVAGLAHALYVVRVGGDFMHGRLLLPGLFGLLLPVMVVAPLRWRSAAAPLAAATLAWAAVCAAELRPDRDLNPAVARDIGEERRFYTAQTETPDPVTVEDYAGLNWTDSARTLRNFLALGGDVVELRPFAQRFAPNDPDYPYTLPRREDVPQQVVGVYFAVGLVSYIAGPDVRVVDRLGLADPLAGRLELTSRGRPGHEKLMPLEWPIARYADLASSTEGRALAANPRVAAAVRALGCGDIERVLDAVAEPLTLGRFAGNVGRAFTLHGFRFHPDPVRAAREECGD